LDGLKALLIDFARTDGEKRVALRDNTLVDSITSQIRKKKGIGGGWSIGSDAFLL
jgi:hypothetical protein